MKPHEAAPFCPICLGAAFEKFSQFRFGVWDESGAVLARRRYAYDLLECRVCRHVMVDHAYGPDFVPALYALPQSQERWTVDDTPPEAPYAEMIEFFGAADLPTSGWIVDFGCGPGVLLGLLARRYRAPRDHLIGADFTVPPELPAVAAPVDLDRLETAGPQPFDGFAAAFCSHTLEHLSDPRGFLRSLRLRAAPGARLYLETPDHALDDMAATELANMQNAQHLQYFTLRTLRLVAESCGWRTLKADASWFGFVPRARLLLVADDVAEAGDATRRSDAHFNKLFSAAADRLLRLTRGGDQPALWGLGGDLERMAERSPELAAALAAGAFLLADGGLAGRVFDGRTVLGPADLAELPGPVAITPRPAKIRATMEAAASRLGIAARRLCNPYCD